MTLDNNWLEKPHDETCSIPHEKPNPVVAAVIVISITSFLIIGAIFYVHVAF